MRETFLVLIFSGFGSVAMANAAEKGSDFYLTAGVGAESGTFSLSTIMSANGYSTGEMAIADFSVSGQSKDLCAGYEQRLWQYPVWVGARFCGHFGTVSGSWSRTTADGRAGLRFSAETRREYSLMATLAVRPTPQWPTIEFFGGKAAANMELTATAWAGSYETTHVEAGWAVGEVVGVSLSWPIGKCVRACAEVGVSYTRYTYKGKLTETMGPVQARLDASQPSEVLGTFLKLPTKRIFAGIDGSSGYSPRKASRLYYGT